MKKEKAEFFSRLTDIYPVLLHYGDTIWRKGWFKYTQKVNPNGVVMSDVDPPKFSLGRGPKYVTRSSSGQEFPGIGVVAANLTGPDKNLEKNVRLIFDSDPNVETILYIDKDGAYLDWIGRDDEDCFW